MKASTTASTSAASSKTQAAYDEAAENLKVHMDWLAKYLAGEAVVSPDGKLDTPGNGRLHKRFLVGDKLTL